MPIVWETRRTDSEGHTRSITSEITEVGQYVTKFISPESGSHIYSGRDLLFLRDVIFEAVERLEFELSDADLYDRIRSLEEERPARAGKRWTLEEHEHLVDLINQGNTVGDIAKKLERSPMSIVTRMLMKGIADIVPLKPVS